MLEAEARSRYSSRARRRSCGRRRAASNGAST
jgi:hypothetical protein